MEENGGGLFFEVPITFCLEKLFYVCLVYIQDQSFNNFENDTMKVSVNEAKLTGLWARNWATIQLVLISNLPSHTKTCGAFRETGPRERAYFRTYPVVTFVFIQVVNETVL